MEHLPGNINLDVFKQATEQCVCSVLITDAQGIILYVNRAFTLASGYSAAEVEGRTPSVLNSGKHNKEFFKDLWDTILAGKTWRGEILNRKKNGTLYRESQVISAVHSNNGKITHFVCTKEEITNNENAEKALFESEERFRLFFEENKIAILVVDAETVKIVDANNAALDFYGYNRQEFYSLDLKNEFIGFAEAIQAGADGKFQQPKNIFSQKHRTSSGRVLDVEISLGRVAYHERNYIYVMVIDVTKRKRAIAALKESESKKLALLKIIPDLIFVLNSDGIFLDIYSDNPDRLGIEPYKLLSRHVSSFFPPEISSLLLQKIKAALDSREVQTFDFRYKQPTGRYAFEEVRVIASGNQEVLVIIRDISKRKFYESEIKKAWEEAEQANKIKSVFLANLSHEIRTPINAILGFSNILGDELSDHTQLRYIEAIKSSSKTLLELINDLLDLSKIESGKMNISKSPVDLRKLFSEVYNIFSIRLNEKSLLYTCTIDDEVPRTVFFDELRLKQVLFNLIGNAVKFTDSGTIKVNVSATVNMQGVVPGFVNLKVSIKDTGIGIDKKNQLEIFDAFRQQDTQDTRKYGGTGLGLAITKRLVEMLNGTIALESEPGKGSEFSVTFFNVEPISEPLNDFKEQESFKAGQLIFKPVKILIADDVELNRDFLKDVFKGSEMIFCEASDGAEAIELVKKNMPALALLDLRMPLVDGLDVAAFIKTNSAYRHIVTFGISATLVDESLDKRVGYFDEFLLKPVDISLFLKQVSKYVPVIKILRTVEKTERLTDLGIENNNTITGERFTALVRELTPLLEKLSHTSSFADYENFGKILVQRGEELEIIQLTLIGRQIIEAVESFDLEAISKSINSYKSLERKILENNI